MFGTTTPAALRLAKELGVDVRTYDPSRGTFHPKVYLGISGDGAARAVIGSANLTAGLASNVEAGMYLEGTLRDEPLKSAWQWAEERWGDPVVEYWKPRDSDAGGDECIEPDLYALLTAAVARDNVFPTLGPNPRPNIVRELTPTGLLVETPQSKAAGAGPQPLPAWMLNVAWGYLKTHSELTNQHLLKELRVHRSSAVCALLARLPGVVPFRDGARIGVRLLRPDLESAKLTDLSSLTGVSRSPCMRGP